ncbi:MAG: SMC-Scp complex subunit ScpB [Selenomonas sp.]|uniref:SMC-Scp complex subunit ScpB n=1 Tax=unclassified Selenomonas TaxID=2637378 RepID=UPI000496E51D|nr:SMC-Scp complex subunit ScpB [Selenomonas sp.]SEH21038.1 segregation and condensation protein B [Selenomonas ruminantium]
MSEGKPTTATLEAVLFAAGDPMSMEDLAGVLQTDLLTTQNLMTRLQRELEEGERGLTIRRVAGGLQLATRPDLYPVVERLSQVVDRKISAPTMETLSIIAFKQPITKQEIEHIRGVRIERALAKLLELELISEVGRKQVLGRPILYGTTDTFLRTFGLNSLEDLPKLPSDREAAVGMDDEQLELLGELEGLMEDEEAGETEETDDNDSSLP